VRVLGQEVVGPTNGSAPREMPDRQVAFLNFKLLRRDFISCSTVQGVRSRTGAARRQNGAYRTLALYRSAQGPPESPAGWRPTVKRSQRRLGRCAMAESRRASDLIDFDPRDAWGTVLDLISNVTRVS
jgi:hypothetical protein